MLALGLATPLAASMLTGVMLTAIRKVHLKNGVWVTEGGFEYNAVLIAALATLVEAGPGPISLDAALGTEKKGGRWSLTALTGGAIASALVINRASQTGAATNEPTPATDQEPSPAEAA